MKTRWLVLILVFCCALPALAVEVTLKDAGDIRLQIYGYVRADMSYETQATAPKADFAFFVLPEAAGEEDAQFHVGARESRLGLNLFGPDDGAWKIMGKIETDFYGSGNPNSYSPRIRLAFVDVAHSSGFALRAGQDWETFIEVIHRIVNFAYLADIGALGLRRPQARLTQELKLAENTKIVAKLAAAQSPDVEDNLRRQIAATDRAIDALVYALYGLTAEEIALVESATAPQTAAMDSETEQPNRS